MEVKKVTLTLEWVEEGILKSKYGFYNNQISALRHALEMAQKKDNEDLSYHIEVEYPDLYK